MEDFTTYTEQNGDISVTSSRCTFITMRRDSVARLYKDFSAGHFGDFEHDFTSVINIAEAGDSSDRSWGNIHSLTDTVDLARNINDGFYISVSQNSDVFGNFRYQLTQKEDGTKLDFDLGVIRLVDFYYLTIKRSGTLGTVKIYSDSDRTNLLETLSITCNTTTYQYLLVVQAGGWTSDPADYINGYIEDLDFQTDPTPTTTSTSTTSTSTSTTSTSTSTTSTSTSTSTTSTSTSTSTTAPPHTGWTGKIMGVTNPRKVGGIPVNQIKKINNL